MLDTAVNEADGSVGFLVTLDPAATGVVTVQYTTVDATAVAPTDYAATSGTLTFAPGDTRKQTALVPIVDDGEEDTGETFRLVLSNPTGSDANNGAAVLGDAEAVATILNSEREAASLTGFTLVDAGTNGDLMALADGSTVELGELLASSYGIRAEMSAGAAPGSVRLALTGAKTVTATDDAAPWSLYGDGAGRVNGGSLPPGSYTLTATAYADSGGRGAELGSLEVSFTVAAGALGVTTPGPFTVAEGETAVAQLAASDTGTGDEASWSIPAGAEGGADGAAFALTSEGVLSLVVAKDFEAPDDADGDGTYEVTVAVAVPASSMAGAQRATAALLVTLSDVNEAPVAQASASPERVPEGARVTLDGSASTDPDAGDTLTYLWTQADDGARRVTLSDASAEQPAFTSPSDLSAETELAFTLRVTDAGGLYAEDTVTVTVTLISEVSISAASNYAVEGDEAVFRLTRAGSARAALTVPVTVEETGAMLGVDVPAGATFAAGSRETELRVPTAADAAPETDSRVTARLGSGSGWQLAPGAEAASVTVLDDDAAPETETAAADVTIWSADMTVVAYSPRAIGAGTADLFSNQQGRAGLRATRLWYDPPERELRLGFDDGLDDAELLTLHVGAVSVGFPANSGGDSSFTLENVDVSWTDGETLAVRISKPSASAVSTDATLASLEVGGATLSPAFDARVVLYWAVADAGAERVTLTARANDDGATVAYGPAADADAALADHQVTAPTEGEILVAATVTAADGTVRRYRVVVAPTAAESNTAPTGAPTISGTPQVGETLTADVSAIADADGLTNVSYSYQWIRNDGNSDSDIPGATDTTYTLDADDVGKTVKVRVTFTDDADNEETLTSAATAAVASRPNSPATGAPTISGTVQVDETLTADTSGITDADGLSDVSYSYQWIRNDGTNDSDIGGQTGSTYTLTDEDVGKSIKVKVSFTDDAGNEETLTSAAMAAVAARPDTPATGAPTISGTAHPGETLTADTADIADEDGLDNATFSYQWITNDGNADTDIAGETGSTYEVSDDDVGKTVKVRVSFTDDRNNEETLTSAATAAVAATPNSPATGLPTISGTVQVDETLTADTSGISDADGLTNVSYSYQWIRNDGTNDSDIGGQTGSTYTLVSADEGKTIKVRVSFTDDAGNEETLTSAATAAVAAAPSRLTVSLENGATTHDGSAVFTFEIRFSEELALSYTTLKFHAFDVTGGEVLKAQRMDKPSNIRWLITVGPDVNGDVTVVLPVTEDCAAQGAICTEDGRPLSNRLQMTVTGPLSADQNTEATGAPTISGTAQVGETLTADVSSINDADGLTNVSYSYQWIANDGTNDADIGGQTGSTYTLVSADEGKTIKMRVSFTDDAGNEETLTSAATAAVASRPNTPATGAPTINGTVQVDQTLTADVSSINDADGLTNVSYSYQWVRNDGTTDAEIQGATDDSYTLVADDAGKFIKVKVSFTDEEGNDESRTSVATAAVAAAPPQPSPDLTVTLSISIPAGGFIVGSSFQFGATVRNDGDGAAEATTLRYYQSDDAAITPSDTELGTDAVGALAASGAGSISRESIDVTAPSTPGRYYYNACVDAVEGESNRTNNCYLFSIGVLVTLEPDLEVGTPTVDDSGLDTGETFTLSATVSNSGGGPSAATTLRYYRSTDATITTSDTSVGTDAVEGLAASGTSSESVSLTAPATAGTYYYGACVEAVTGESDTTNNCSSSVLVAVAAAPPVNSPATGQPTISGTPQVGETLTAGTANIDDQDGLPADDEFTYQWIRVDGATDTDIAGETSVNYTLVDADEGKTIKVTVSFTDDASNPETLTSAATDAVTAKPNSPATGLPAISGTAQVEETLTADTSGIADADGLTNVSYSYQWLANDADIQNATDSTYTLTDDDVGKTIKVRVSFTDDRSNDETLTSAATDTVVAKPDSPDTDAPPRDPGATVDVTVGNTVTGEIEEAIEVDWFKVSLLASETYQIDMRGAWGGEWARIDGEIVWVAPGTLHDPKLLGVFSAANVLVPGTDEEVSGDDRGDYEEGKNSRITSFSPPADGYYYIAAAAEAAWTGTYELTVTVVADE